MRVRYRDNGTVRISDDSTSSGYQLLELGRWDFLCGFSQEALHTDKVVVQLYQVPPSVAATVHAWQSG